MEKDMERIENEAMEEITNHSLGKVRIESLYKQALSIHEKCNDYTAVPNAHDEVNMFFDPEAGALSFNDDVGASHNLPLSRHALSQLCAKVGVPVRYMERCVQSGRFDLASDNVNSWLEDYDRSLFVREHAGKVRGILSDRYMVLDGHEILESVCEGIKNTDYTVQGSYITPERLHARLIGSEMLPIPGEDLFAGFQLDSSDVGRSVIAIRFFLFKQVCTNGLVVSKGSFDLFRRKHLGGYRSDLLGDFRGAMVQLEETIANSVNVILAAQNKASFLLHNNVYPEREVAVPKLRQFGFSLGESEGILDVLEDGKYDKNTRWGLINSITEAAQRYTLERRIAMEEIAGEILVGSAA